MICQKPELLDPNHIISCYQPNCSKLFSEPVSSGLVQVIINALRNQLPFSVIRMGDGEMNIMTYSDYPQLPTMSSQAVKLSIHKREQSFKATHEWMFVLEKLMKSAVREADVIGVLGLWRTNKNLTTQQFKEKLAKNIRGRFGHWVGLDYMTGLAQQGLFKQQIITTAHLYFSVNNQLSEILKHVQDVFLITGTTKAYDVLSLRQPCNRFHLITLPETGRPLKNTGPYFFSETMNQLPSDMSGTLTLIGAGPWSEYYCSWVKQRGGVAIDIGSGFDLLVGNKVRPVHQKVDISINH